MALKIIFISITNWLTCNNNPCSAIRIPFTWRHQLVIRNIQHVEWKILQNRVWRKKMEISKRKTCDFVSKEIWFSYLNTCISIYSMWIFPCKFFQFFQFSPFSPFDGIQREVCWRETGRTSKIVFPSSLLLFTMLFWSQGIGSIKEENTKIMFQ